MNEKDIADLFIQGVGKIEFYWHFYTGTVLVLIGWMVSASVPLNRRLKILLTLAFFAFALMNLVGLWGSYEFTEAIRRDLVALPASTFAHAHALLSQRDFLDHRTLGIVVHVVSDLFVVGVIWFVPLGKGQKEPRAPV